MEEKRRLEIRLRFAGSSVLTIFSSCFQYKKTLTSCSRPKTKIHVFLTLLTSFYSPQGLNCWNALEISVGTFSYIQTDNYTYSQVFIALSPGRFRSRHLVDPSPRFKFSACIQNPLAKAWQRRQHLCLRLAMGLFWGKFWPRFLRNLVISGLKSDDDDVRMQSHDTIRSNTDSVSCSSLHWPIRQK